MAHGTRQLQLVSQTSTLYLKFMKKKNVSLMEWLMACADSKKAPSKENKHRAMDDIRESIRELKYYRENIFKASKSKK